MGEVLAEAAVVEEFAERQRLRVGVAITRGASRLNRKISCARCALNGTNLLRDRSASGKTVDGRYVGSVHEHREANVGGVFWDFQGQAAAALFVPIPDVAAVEETATGRQPA